MAEVWALAAAGVTAAGAVGASLISSGALSGGSKGGGTGDMPDFVKDVLKQIQDIKLNPPKSVPGINYSPTIYDPQTLLGLKYPGSGNMGKGISTKPGKNLVPLYKRDKNGKVIYKNGKPEVNTNESGETLYAPESTFTYKKDKSGNPIKDENGIVKIDIGASSKTNIGNKSDVMLGSKKLYGDKLDTLKYKNTVKRDTITFDPQKGVDDLGRQMGYTGDLADQTNQENQSNIARREQVAPGTAANLAKGNEVINSWLNGEVPDDVVQQVLSGAASSAGGTFNPFASGGANQGAPSQFAKNLGLTSLDIQGMGTSMAPTWASLADSLTVKPGELFGRANANNQMEYSYDVLATNTKLEQDQRRYANKLNNNIIRNSPNPRARGALEDFLKLTSINDTNALAVEQLRYNTARDASMREYNYGLDLANLELQKSGAALGLAPSLIQSQNQTNPWATAFATAVPYIAGAAGNAASSYFGGQPATATGSGFNPANYNNGMS